MAPSSPPSRSGLGGPDRAHRRFFLWFVGTVLGIVAIFTLVNTRVNPLLVTQVDGWTDDAGFAKYRQYFRSLRTAKAGLATAEPWEVAFCGSSRVAIALDPAMPEWGDRKVVNLGLSGASLGENFGVISYLIAHQPQIRTIYLGVDLTDLTTVTEMARNAGYYESRFNAGGDAAERELRYHVGVSSFKASVETIKNRINYEKDPQEMNLPPYNSLGHWVRKRSSRPTRDIIYTDSVPLALRMIRQRHAKLEIFPAKLKALTDILRICQDHGIELKILIPPNHATYHAIFYLANDADPGFRMDRETIVNLVAESNAAYPQAPPVTVWDFNDFHPLNAETLPPLHDKTSKPHYWADGTHALETLGHVMLRRMNHWPIQDPREEGYGRQIDTHNLEDRLKELREGYERYRDENPAEMEWLEELMAAYSATGNDLVPLTEEEPPAPAQ